MRRLLPVIVIAAALLLGGGGRDLLDRLRDEAGGTSGSSGKGRVARVVRVVDGDTIVVRLGGAEERIRYIGMDTPETVKPGTPVQCFGRQASAENHRLVDGRRVRLVLDAEARDRYGRMLAYVYREPDDLFVNAALVQRGYATPMTIPPNVRFADRFVAWSRAARQAGRGLWSACER
ncbi:MAG TPA: thermonuclease family protein [Baekduia sp.]|nr:thermonuclease family protein [Baekduia sp.]